MPKGRCQSVVKLATLHSCLSGNDAVSYQLKPLLGRMMCMHQTTLEQYEHVHVEAEVEPAIQSQAL